MKENERLNYKAEIRNYHSLGLTPETTARTMGGKQSRTFVYKKKRHNGNQLAKTKDRTGGGYLNGESSYRRRLVSKVTSGHR